MAILSIGSSYSSAASAALHAVGNSVDASAQRVVVSSNGSSVAQVKLAAPTPSQSPSQTYTAAGLLANDAVVAATSPAGNAEGSTNTTRQQSPSDPQANKALVADLSSKAVLSGVYNGVGVLEVAPFSRVTDLGSLLRSNPQLSLTLVGNAYDQGVIEALDIIA